MLSFQTFEFRMSSLRKFDFRCHYSKHFNSEWLNSILFRIGDFQPFEFRFFSSGHLSYYCVIARFKCTKPTAPSLYLVLLFCNVMELILYLFLSFSFSVIAWNSKFICIGFLDKKNREGHEWQYKVCIALLLFHESVHYVFLLDPLSLQDSSHWRWRVPCVKYPLQGDPRFHLICTPPRRASLWFPLFPSDIGLTPGNWSGVQGGYPMCHSILSHPKRASLLVPLPLDLGAPLLPVFFRLLSCVFSV